MKTFEIEKYDTFQITGKGTVFTIHKGDHDFVHDISKGDIIKTLDTKKRYEVRGVEMFRTTFGIGKNVGVLVKEKKVMTAFELCGKYDAERFKLKGGRIVWEAISYSDRCDKCRISRVVEEGGKPFFMGLRYKQRYIDPDTEVIIVES